MESFAYFPTLVYRDEKPELVSKILPGCLNELNKVRQPGWGMVQSLHLGGHPEFEELSTYLLSAASEILVQQGYSLDRYELYLQGLWAQELFGGAGTDAHVHKNSQLCGWFFLETPEGGAYPLYHDPRTNKAMVELDFIQGNDITNATSAINFASVAPGSVLFSNSWMRHQLAPGVSEHPTRCVHFIIAHKERMCNTC